MTTADSLRPDPPDSPVPNEPEHPLIDAETRRAIRAARDAIRSSRELLERTRESLEERPQQPRERGDSR